MKFKNRKHVSIFAAALLFLPALSNSIHADTLVSGPVSGTWTTTGSPYRAYGNLTVASGTNLTIQPGVKLIMYQGIRMDAAGAIIANGTGAQPIIIQGINPTTYWDTISITYGTIPSSFANCIISEGTNALSLSIDGILAGSVLMNTPIQNCIITNCLNSSIFGYSHGNIYNYIGGQVVYNPTNNPQIQNCRFGTSSNGCVFLADGVKDGNSGPYGRGAVNPQILNCDFVAINGSAIIFSNGPYAATNYPVIENNVFLQCTTALQQTSSTVFNDAPQYNCFFNNQTNFSGYAVSFGSLCCQNVRGTNCDPFNNIFVNPLFAETTSYSLAANSPCIDAGAPEWALSDTCFPPSQGSATNDLGIYGGPNACNWLAPVPILPTYLTLTKSNSALWLSWGAIPRSSYLVQYIPTNLFATSGTNKWLNNTTLIPAAKPVSIAVSPYPSSNNTSFYRVKSLGRTPGN